MVPRSLRLFCRWLLLGLVAETLLTCAPASRHEQEQKEQVQAVFADFKHAIFAAHAAEALRHVDQASIDYLRSAIQTPPDPAANDDEIRQLIRQAVLKMAPGASGPNLRLDDSLQRILNQGWMNTHALDSIALGPVTITGGGARAEALWQGKPTPYQFSFVRENNQWKVDLLGLVLYAELGLGLERALKGETEAHQLERLVGLIPAPWNSAAP
jgi:hypothetical protein